MRAWLLTEADLATRDALLHQARDLRLAGRVDEALTVLDQLQRLQPRFSRAYQERGHCHVLQHHTEPACAALEEAVRLNPTLPTSWDMLAQLYRLTSNHQGAEAAATVCRLRQCTRSASDTTTRQRASQRA